MKNKPAILVVIVLLSVLTAQAISAQTCIPDMTFVADVTVPDDTVMQPGETFVKTWRLQNTGSTDWNDDYSLVFIEGDQLDGQSPQSLSQVVSPGHTVDFAVSLQAPQLDGIYTSFWELRDEAGITVGKKFYLRIRVGQSAQTDAYAGWQRFENSTGQWSILYPPGWTLEFEGDRTTTFVNWATETFVVVNVSEDPVDIEKFKATGQETLLASVVDSELADGSYLTSVDSGPWSYGTEGVYATLEAGHPDTVGEAIVWYIAAPDALGNLVAFEWTRRESATEAEKQEIGKMLASVNLPITPTPPQEEGPPLIEGQTSRQEDTGPTTYRMYNPVRLGNWEFYVYKVHRQKQVWASSNQPITAEGVYALVRLKVTNHSAGTRSMWDDLAFAALDEDGNIYGAVPDLDTRLAAHRHVTDHTDSLLGIEPNAPALPVLETLEVAENAQELWLLVMDNRTEEIAKIYLSPCQSDTEQICEGRFIDVKPKD